MPTTGRNGSGVPSTRRCRRPAASRAGWSRPKASSWSTKNSSSVRAKAPAERPGRRDRSSSAWGWSGPLSRSSRPTAVIITQARSMQCRSAAKSANSPSHHGGSGSAAARLSAWLRARCGCRCQQRPHSPLLSRRTITLHVEHGLGGRGAGRDREQVPHRPVSGRMNPGRPQRGQGCFDAAASARRRHGRHRTLVLKRSTWPQSMQMREQRTQRPVSGANRRNRAQFGQAARSVASWSAPRQR